ncbi:T9SS type A sorting domain-containing protein [Taibaiella soli]|uniref:DUF11 domain-containing protein n=1 Tax=Taibaiella soli TaxID=1649169 RepID=A0A2W2ALA8_9BACT|nr:T9SS type A sorting domain-containing protein [Taibaiella soli]PZF74362.1 hypothetical protein DN068_01930 [Taibaiella soli]
MGKCLINFLLCALLLPQVIWAQQSPDIVISSVQTPALTPCSGQGTFTLRLTNLTASPISNIVVRDSMPPNVSYVSGSVSGTNVSFGSTVASNVVTFNVSSLAASQVLDISFNASANCAISTDPTMITNTYKASWGTFFGAPIKTSTYSALFPSLSITPGSTGTFNANCLTPFVRSFTICNGGFGSVDSVVFTDAENQSSLVVQGFSLGTQTGLGTSSAKTVLHAADFMSVGNGDGKLDQNECIVVYDTLNVTGSTSPIVGTYKATWGCSGSICTNPSSNTYTLNTTINASSPLQPALTRTMYVLGTPDSPNHIYRQGMKYMEVVKNNSSVTAVNAKIMPIVYGLRYINTDSIWASKNGGTRYHPAMAKVGNPYAWSAGAPSDYANSLNTFTNSDKPTNEELTLGDLAPGDSVVVTFEVNTAGPVTRVNVSPFDHCWAEAFCGGCARGMYGPAISGAADARMTWQGCPSGTFSSCALRFGQKMFNGVSTTLVTENDVTSGYGHMLARFNGYSGFTDSTNLDGSRCAYFENDTVRVLMHVDNLDLPFYTSKSQFYIKIYTNGGSKWDGKLARTFGRITSWSSTPWYPDHVVDSSAIDSTIRVYFKIGNCPIPNFTTKDVNNSYGGGGWDLSIGFVNTCPGAAQKRVYMTRVYTVDTTSGEPAIESGTNTFPSNYTWNSKCAGACPNGVSVLSYGEARTTFGAPDNDQNGLPDASGSINMSKVATKLITWGDTMQLSYKMVVHTTNPGGVPYLYVNSSINYSTLSSAVTMNGSLSKDYPVITLMRPGVGSFTGTSSSLPVNNSNSFTSNLSLQGAGGVAIPGITTYQEGDTVLLTQNIVYNKAHSGWGVITWSFQHNPYISTVINPTAAQQMRCDSVICNFQTVDMDIAASTSTTTASNCSDSVTFRWGIRAQETGSGCGTNVFPYESRNVYTPVTAKIAIPAASNYTFRSVKLYWTRVITGSGNQCGSPINGVMLTPSQYSVVGDTLYLDFRQLCTSLGLDYKQNNLYSIFQVDVTVKYNLAVAGCNKDQLRPSYSFPVVYRFETSRPMDTTVNPTYYNGTSNTGSSATIQWAGANANTPSLYAGSSSVVTRNVMVVPVRYTVNNTTGLTGNCWMAIPSTAGVIVDSVKVKTTGALVPQTPAGSAIYQLGDLGGNGSTKDYDVYTHLIQCVNTPFNIYADRSPCNGYPTSWSAYACQSSAKVATYTYTTFPGELQMTDSLFSASKEVCVDDTLQFAVVNSQTQTANSVRIGFNIPSGMSLVPGATYLSYGNGSYVPVSDPVLSNGSYVWIQPASDTLAPVSQTPANIMYLRVVLSTSCGYISGSQITSTINGNVACGPITSLYNTNPAPLSIIGAPSLSYLTNPKATVTPLAGCGMGQSIKLVLHVSGGVSRTGDTARFILPKDYYFVSYDPAAAGSYNAPSDQPSVGTQGDGSTVISWGSPGGVAAGDSVVFSFVYNERNLSNKCKTDASRRAIFTTYITSGVFCVKTNGICPVSIANGSDTTAPLLSMRPTLSAKTDSVFYGPGAAPNNPYHSYSSQLHITGSIKNAGPGAVAEGTPIYMETFIDVDNNGVISAGDTQYNSYIYKGGIAVGDSVAIEFLDTTSHRYCLPCYQKNVLIRFTDAPTLPSSASQCLCDSTTSSMVPQAFVMLPLVISMNDFSIMQKNCNTAIVQWKNMDNPAQELSYQIEMSEDGAHFTTVNTVIPADPIGTVYSRNVVLPTGVSYLRLTQMLNGNKAYSPVKMMQNTCQGQGDELKVAPNPFEGGPLTVTVTETEAGAVTVKVMSTEGKVLSRLDKDVVAGKNEFEISDLDHLAPGAYIVWVQHADGTVGTQKLIRK